MRYIKKVRECEAWQWNGKTQADLEEFMELTGLKDAYFGELYCRQGVIFKNFAGIKSILEKGDFLKKTDNVYGIEGNVGYDQISRESLEKMYEPKHNTPSVTFSGFNSVEDAQAFIDWYSGSGEQEASCWQGENSLGSDWSISKNGLKAEVNE